MHDVMVFLFSVYVTHTHKLCHTVDCPLILFHNKHQLYLLGWDGVTVTEMLGSWMRLRELATQVMTTKGHSNSRKTTIKGIVSLYKA